MTICIGHRGAAHLAPENTLAGFDAALKAGVDMIEFDVLPENPEEPARFPLLVAHDYEHATDAPTLSECLKHFSGTPFDGVRFILDLKGRRYAHLVVKELTEHDFLSRAIIAGNINNLTEVRRIEPSLGISWTVPQAKTDYTASRFWRRPAKVALKYLRKQLPGTVSARLRNGECNAITANWRVVTPELLEAIREANGKLYVWTVDDLKQMRLLMDLGVDGIITNNPPLFHEVAAGRS